MTDVNQKKYQTNCMRFQAKFCIYIIKIKYVATAWKSMAIGGNAQFLANIQVLRPFKCKKLKRSENFMVQKYVQLIHLLVRVYEITFLYHIVSQASVDTHLYDFLSPILAS